MRVTQTMISGAIKKHVSMNAERIFKTQETISSGKKIVKPSDDPLGMSNLIRYRKSLASLDQYQRNIVQGRTELELGESALIEVNESLLRARELALAQANATATLETRRIAADEIRHIQDHMVQLANTPLDDRYLFGGMRTDAPPYDPANPSAGFQGDNGEFHTIIGQGVTLATNARGEMAFSRDVDSVVVLEDLITALEADDSTEIQNSLDQIEKAMTQTSDSRADIGARLNRLDSTEYRWDSVRFSIQGMMSETEDTDITRAIADLTSHETAYQASIAVSAKTFQQSLLDYLR